LSVAAAYYDGQTSLRREVRLYGAGATLSVEGAGVRRTARIDDVVITERLGSAPRLVKFADGAFCEVRDHAGFDALLTALGRRESAVERWQRNRAIAAASAVLVAAALVAAYLYGLPWAAARAAERLPDDVNRMLSRQTLQALEGGLVGKSQLPEERRRQIVEGFAALKRPPGTTADVDLLFRASGFGPNAFALPDGTVVLLDELVALCDHDEQVYAVLGHELGHVHHRHGVRLLLQGSFAGLLAAWWIGDLSGLWASAPAALLQARYSRGFEGEADRYAAELLEANGMPPARLAEALEKLAAAHGRSAGGGEGWIDYLSSHPAPRERLAALRDR
jgi:Zn-dependent protease with chaperone function